MLRRFLTALFVLVNLTTQANVAFACGMMGGATMPMNHCCCHESMAAPGSGTGESSGGCCDIVVDLSSDAADHAGNVASTLPNLDPQLLAPALMPALLAIVLPSTTPVTSWDDGGGGAGGLGTDTYLRTQRLRL